MKYENYANLIKNKQSTKKAFWAQWAQKILVLKYVKKY